LETALARILRCDVALTVAGRTTRVHATGQWPTSTFPLRCGNRSVVAGPAIGRGAATGCTGVAADPWWPRSTPGSGADIGDTTIGSPTPNGAAAPLCRFDTLAWPRRLDVEAMPGGGGLLGEHDFVAFCRRREGASTIRTLQRLSVLRDGELVTCTVQADASATDGAQPGRLRCWRWATGGMIRLARASARTP